jgi:hypothetical protein
MPGSARGASRPVHRSREGAARTHPNAICLAANAAFAAAIAVGIECVDPDTTIAFAHAYAGNDASADKVRAWLFQSLPGLPGEFSETAGWVRIALIDAFHRLRSGQSLEEALDRYRSGGRRHRHQRCDLRRIFGSSARAIGRATEVETAGIVMQGRGCPRCGLPSADTLLGRRYHGTGGSTGSHVTGHARRLRGKS